MRRPLQQFSAILCLAATLAAAIPGWVLAADLAPAPERIGRLVDNFSIRDCRGAEITFNGFAEKDVIVLVFLGTECPLAKLYGASLNKLAAKYEPQGAAFVAIDANCQDSLAEMLQFAKDHGLIIPFAKDVGGALADRLGAERTPEAYVLDKERIVRYVGRIDDQFGIGFQRVRPTREDLSEAIEEVLAGQTVKVPTTTSVGCRIGRMLPTKVVSEVTWANSIAAIFQKNCHDCHRPGQIGPFPLLTYDDTVGWWETIAEVIAEERMPPWYADPAHGSFANDSRLQEEEKKLIHQWIQGGAPRGDRTNEPPPREFKEGWQIEQPDQVVYISPEPFEVPAEGVLEYQWFEADPGFTEDKWIKAVECRPGNPAVVHHVTVYFSPPGGSPLRLRDRINLVGGFAPGKRSLHVPWDGTAKFVPAGSTFRFEMHYTTNGTPQVDRSSIAILFADPKEVRKQLSVVLVADETFAIPPHAADFEVKSRYTLDEDSHLRVMSPHMHLRGKSFQFDALYPDGRLETLLRVPRFDFNWQLDYLLTEPKELPKGTTIECTATFDNSEDNPSNPDPTAEVRWGEQTWEEMMIGAITITPAHQDLIAKVGRGVLYPEISLRRRALQLVVIVGIVAAAAGLVWYLRPRPPVVAR